jgi:hypothetical protein
MFTEIRYQGVGVQIAAANSLVFGSLPRIYPAKRRTLANAAAKRRSIVGRNRLEDSTQCTMYLRVGKEVQEVLR